MYVGLHIHDYVYMHDDYVFIHHVYTHNYTYIYDKDYISYGTLGSRIILEYIRILIIIYSNSDYILECLYVRILIIIYSNSNSNSNYILEHLYIRILIKFSDYIL